MKVNTCMLRLSDSPNDRASLITVDSITCISSLNEIHWVKHMVKLVININ